MAKTTESTAHGAEEPTIADTPEIELDPNHLLESLRKNLFKDAKNTVLTLVFSVVLAYILYRAYGFVFDNQKLTPDGELVNSWRVIRTQLTTYMVGTQFQATGIGFPMLWTAIYLTVFAVGFASAPMPGVERVPSTLRTKLAIGAPVILGAAVLLNYTETMTPKLLTVGLVAPYLVGQRLMPKLGVAVMQRRGILLAALGALIFLVETGFSPGNVDKFGGLLLTVNVAFISIALCFPIGVVMALARRSSFPLIRPLAVGYIELIRGVPLITLLFMGQYALAFFLPPGTDSPPAVIKAIIMVTLFSAAYVAEIVRGGLQSVPNGQTEAGQAVGLAPLTITRRIVLPQALRNSIPALVGQFIALLKDTTLLVIISQFDLLGVSRPILAAPEFQNQGYTPEVYAFVAFVFWVICFSMSRASQRLETKLGVGTR
jgi:general L-amino acid transport system permease protein